jgi:hypothetical protein
MLATPESPDFWYRGIKMDGQGVEPKPLSEFENIPEPSFDRVPDHTHSTDYYKRLRSFEKGSELEE